MTELKINGKVYQVNAEEDTPLLWAIRDSIGLTGTKYGCGIQQCGACTVLIKGRAVRSCGVTISEVAGDEITTIEGLSPESRHPVQKAWIEEQVPQRHRLSMPRSMSLSVGLGLRSSNETAAMICPDWQ